MRIRLLVGILLGLSLNTFSQSSSIDTLYTFKSFDGTVISFQVKGSGYPVLLVHGFIVNSDSWKKSSLYTNLLTSGFKVITLDLRGNGRSDHPHKPEAYANDAEAKDISALADRLGLKQYSVVGYSRGAIIASRALVLDTHVDKVVLGGMGSDFTNPNWPRRIMFYEALSGKPVKELEGVIRYVQEAGLDQQALACMQKEQPSTSKEEFSRVKKPVLVICGAEDEDNGSSKTLAAFIPGSQYTQVPGNHNNASHSKEFANEVIRFLKEKR
jgi:pimeloyl-ACP methyl ester carboxylesterase